MGMQNTAGLPLGEEMMMAMSMQLKNHGAKIKTKTCFPKKAFNSRFCCNF
jgi:hypothetical protein